MSDVQTDHEPLEDFEEEPEQRHLPPVLYPVLALAFGATLVWALSRILLAVSEIEEVDVAGLKIEGKLVTAIIGLFVALNILVGAALVAYGRRVRRRPASWPLLVGAAVAVVGAGFVAQALEPGEAEGGEPQPTTIALSASGLEFDTAELSMPAEHPVVIEFANQDQGTPHNVSIYTDDTAAEAVFTGELITGVATTRYQFESPRSGEYFFRCDVHPTDMTGTVTVTEAPPGGEPGGAPGGGGPGGGPGGGGGPVSLAARDLAFSESRIEVPAGSNVEVDFANEGQQPHNFSVYTDSTAATSLFSGSLVDPGSTTTYTFEAPDPGEYFFRCDVHPMDMTGTFVVR
jgi:plastocyanin